MRAKLLVGAVALFLAVVQARSYRVLLTWDANPAHEGVTNYVVFVGTNSNVVVHTNFLGQPIGTNHVFSWTNHTGGAVSNIVSNLVAGTRYWFAVKAQNDWGLSDFSEEITLLRPTGPFLVIGAVLEGATNVVGPWSTRVSFPPVIFLYPTNQDEMLRARLLWDRHTNAAPSPP